MLDLIIKIFVTVFVIVLIPFYWKDYGPGNFLWLSDISLFLTLWTLWGRSRFANSLTVLAIMPVEIFWMADFFYYLFMGEELTGIAAYMFDSQKAFHMRALSSFHLFLPPIWVWYLYKWGYDKRVFKHSLILVWCAFLLSFFLTKPEDNINWVHATEKYNLDWIGKYQWLAVMLAGFSLLIYWPFHKLLLRLCKK